MKSKYKNKHLDTEVEDIERFIENSKFILIRMKKDERKDKLKEIFGDDIG
jgi:hypothetical protein